MLNSNLEETLKNKLDDTWKYFNDKNSKLDEEIGKLELKFADRKDLISKMVMARKHLLVLNHLCLGILR